MMTKYTNRFKNFLTGHSSTERDAAATGQADTGRQAPPNPWERYEENDGLPGIHDEFMRYKVETATEQALRETFSTTVENAKDPTEKALLRDQVGQQNINSNGLKSHPILAKFKQFFNREISLLPTMDVEQQIKHNELQHQKKYLKDLQKRNEQEMSPTRK